MFVIFVFDFPGEKIFKKNIFSLSALLSTTVSGFVFEVSSKKTFVLFVRFVVALCF
jgi:hypothetical protein